MDGNGDFLGMVMGDGKENVPALKFGFEPDTGIYRESSEPTSFTIVKRGVKRVRCTDTETEIVGPVVIDDIKLDGATVQNIQVDGQLTIRDGTQEDPSIKFLAAAHTGIFRDGTGIGFTQGSVKKMEIDSSLITGTVPIQGQYFRASDAGTVTTPAYNFEPVATGNGMYYSGGTLKFSAASTERLSLSSASTLTGSLVVSGTTTVGALTTTGTVASGATSVTGTITATDDVKYPRYTMYATRASTQSVNNTTVTDVSFTSSPLNSNFTFTNPTTQFTIPKNGYYSITGTVEYDINATGWRALSIRSGTTNLCQETRMAVADVTNPAATRITISWDAQLTTADGIRLTLYQTSGGSINILAGATLKIDRLHD